MYSEKYFESESFWLEPDEEEDNYWWMKKWVPKPMNNWTHTLRVVRARTPMGPWYDADGHKLGHVGAVSCIVGGALELAGGQPAVSNQNVILSRN